MREIAKRVKPERMDYLEKGAEIGNPFAVIWKWILKIRCAFYSQMRKGG